MLKQEMIYHMQDIVDNCIGDSNPTCIASCFMHANIKEYVKLIGESKGQEGIEVIREKLFIPQILGRICAHPYEQNCKWNEETIQFLSPDLKDMQWEIRLSKID